MMIFSPYYIVVWCGIICRYSTIIDMVPLNEVYLADEEDREKYLNKNY